MGVSVEVGVCVGEIVNVACGIGVSASLTGVVVGIAACVRTTAAWITAGSGVDTWHAVRIKISKVNIKNVFFILPSN